MADVSAARSSPDAPAGERRPSAEDRVVGLMEALETSVREAKAARAMQGQSFRDRVERSIDAASHRPHATLPEVTDAVLATVECLGMYGRDHRSGIHDRSPACDESPSCRPVFVPKRATTSGGPNP